LPLVETSDVYVLFLRACRCSAVPKLLSQQLIESWVQWNCRNDLYLTAAPRVVSMNLFTALNFFSCSTQLETSNL